MRSIVIGTAGHIDHGKSALVHALTGIDPDRLKEEQERGITIDLGFAHLMIGDVNVAFVDVPGHERFIKNMLAGVGGIDGVVLVVAADESVMPQTREHFEICRLLNVRTGIVALTKADLVDAETLELVTLEVKELVRGSFLHSAPVIATSVRTGSGLHDLRAALAALGEQDERRNALGPTRLPIDRVFSMKGFGTVVTGTLVSGTLAIDGDAVRLPNPRSVKIRGLQVHGQKQASVTAGQRVAVNLGGVDLEEIGRGDSIVLPGTFEPTRVLDAAIEMLPGARALRHGSRVRFHQGTKETIGRVSISGLIGPSLNGAMAASDPPVLPSEVGPGRRALVRIRLESEAVLTRGDRFIVRAYSPPETIAGGQVLDPHAPRLGIRTIAGRRRLERMAAGLATSGHDDALSVLLEERGGEGVPFSMLVTRLGWSPLDVPHEIERLEGQGAVVVAGESLVDAGIFRALTGRVVATLREFHRAQPLAEGMPREEVRARLFVRAPPQIFERALGVLVNDGAIVGRDRLALADHRVSLSTEEEDARRTIEGTFREAGLKPPEPSSVAMTAGISPALFERIVGLLVRQKTLVRLDTLLFHQEGLVRLKQEITEMKRRAPPGPVSLDVATFKERYGVTRKFAIPLLEYLDRERVTRRIGDKRIVA